MSGFSFGIFADCQYAEKRPVGNRFYKNSAKKLEECIKVFNKSNLAFIVNLGDLIDGGLSNFKRIVDITSRFAGELHHLAGNHDFEVKDGEKRAVLEILGITGEFRSFTVNGWRFIIIDGTEISLNRYPTSSPERALAAGFRDKWATGSPYWNGGVSRAQLDWLSRELAIAQAAEERVIILSHFPVYPDDVHNLWNAMELSFIQEFHCVKAFISGHNHHGSYATRGGKHYLCVHAMVDTRRRNSFCIIDVHDDKLVVRGFGLEPGRTMPIT